MKDFDTWNEIKKKYDGKNRLLRPAYMKEREIWWLSLGLNIGDEEDGKGGNFERPVVVIKKFNNNLFWGCTLSTKIKESNPYYIKIQTRTGIQSVIISQLRLYDTKRLEEKMETLNQIDFQKITTAIKKLL